MELGLGTMGMSAGEFWWLTPREFHFKLKGYHEREMLRERCEWERTRWQTCLLVNTQTTKTVMPTDLIEFEWEKDEVVVEPLTQEELERIKKLYEH